MSVIPFEKETENFIDATKSVNPIFKKVVQFEEVAHLLKRHIKVLFSKKEMKVKGMRVLGKSSKFGEKDRLLHNYDFLIILDHDFWQSAYGSKREALIFHELLHCGENDKGEPMMRPHDLEEFDAVARRYGPWQNDISRFHRQLELFDGKLEEMAANE